MVKRKHNSFDFKDAQEQLVELISSFSQPSSEVDIRDQVLKIIPAFHQLRVFGINVIPDGGKLAARTRILYYFQRYPEIVIDSDELLVVSGITDYQRRIRELRVEFGWPILSGKTVQSMIADERWPDLQSDIESIKPDQYFFLKSGQDKEAAFRWNESNEIRRLTIGVKDKLLEYFRRNVGRSITGEELSYLASGKKEWARRTRELRTEEGWPIKTRNTGRPELPVGVYVLEEDKQAEPHDRKIDDSIRVSVLERDNYSCRKCGWNGGLRKAEDPRQFLELHHLNYHASKGDNSVDNLVTICNVHHDYIHRFHLNKDAVLEWIGISKL